MKLKQLVKGIPIQEIKGSKEVEITGISADSRTVAPGNLFIAKKGGSFDGTQFIPQAISAGAAAVLTDFYDPFLGVTQLIHQDVRVVEGQLAARYHGDPSKELFVVGITGTKGKTTTTYLVKHLLDGLGKKAGLVGTVETIIGDNRFFSKLTTHDVIANQKILREMVLKGCESVAFEVSSHGLDQGRVDEIEFDVGIFTNLYPDHLDYHPNIDEYAKAKKRLFERTRERAVFNSDSPWWKKMAEGCKADIWTFGVEEKADLQGKNIVFTEKGTEFEVHFQGKKWDFRTKLMGRFNVYNVLGAVAVGLHTGAEMEKMGEILESFETAPGRLESVGKGIFVDFAHSGEALENVLRTMREIARKRVIVIFGCGGNRDPARRKGMAQAAERFADVPIVTSDNPRQEDPNQICKEILEGFKEPKKAIVELDRKKAISLGVGMMENGDLLLIAGKGHEKIQIFAHQTVPFDDVTVAKEALQNRENSAILISSS